MFNDPLEPSGMMFIPSFTKIDQLLGWVLTTVTVKNSLFLYATLCSLMKAENVSWEHISSIFRADE
jgi:hypothetical protein